MRSICEIIFIVEYFIEKSHETTQYHILGK